MRNRTVAHFARVLLLQGLKNVQDFKGPAVRGTGGGTLEASMAKRKKKESKSKKEKNPKGKGKKAGAAAGAAAAAGEGGAASAGGGGSGVGDDGSSKGNVHDKKVRNRKVAKHLQPGQMRGSLSPH